jgi:hypothetical protein
VSERYFKGCPICGEDDGYMNHGRVHFNVCKKHKLKWRIGENLFSSWKYETKEEREEQIRSLSEFTDATDWNRTTGNSDESATEPTNC